MTGNGKIILITGASGFLGGELCRFFAQKGWRVRAMVRNPENSTGWASAGVKEIYECDLPRKIDEEAFQDDPFALIHAAYASRETDVRKAQAVNMQGSRRLKELATKFKVKRFVFLSSLAALPDAVSYYGKSKWAVEQLLDSRQDLILRLGMVIGKGGLFDRLRQSITRLPFIPLFFGGNQPLHTLWVGDLCEAVDHALQRNLSGIYKVGHPQSIELRDFYRALARWEGKKCRFLELPGAPALWALRTLEKMGLYLPVTSENLLGLKQMRVFETGPDLEKLGIRPISLEESLEKLGNEKK